MPGSTIGQTFSESHVTNLNCILFLPFDLFFPGSPPALVAYGGGSLETKVEVVSLSTPLKSCQTIPDLPLGIYAVTGATVNYAPVLCGGENDAG